MWISTRHLAIAALSALALLLIPVYSSSSAFADGSDTVLVDAGDTPPPKLDVISAGSNAVAAPAPAPSSPVATVESDDATLAQSLWTAIQSKDWFIAVGAGLALLIHLARWLLKKKWPSFEKDRWGWMLAAGIAGVVSIATAWLAGKDAATSHTVIGAVKIFAAAIATYVSAKKLSSAT